MKLTFALALLILIAITMLLGFYLTLSELKILRDEAETAEVALRLLSEATVGSSTLPLPVPPSINPTLIPPTKEETKKEDTIRVPAAIILNTRSSPRLEPQVNLPILIESVSRNDDGEVTLALKVFTNEAAGYSALDARDTFEIVNLAAANIKPAEVTGSFDSLPPQSTTTGTVIFKVPQGGDTIILQITTSERVIHYEFNFKKKTYQETVLG